MTTITDHRLDRRLLATYITTVLIFLLLAWRSEVNNRDIADNNARINFNTIRFGQAAWDTCHQGTVHAAAINQTYDLLAAQLRTVKSPDQAALLEAEIYAHSKLDIPDCGPRP